MVVRPALATVTDVTFYLVGSEAEAASLRVLIAGEAEHVNVVVANSRESEAAVKEILSLKMSDSSGGTVYVQDLREATLQ